MGSCRKALEGIEVDVGICIVRVLRWDGAAIVLDLDLAEMSGDAGLPRRKHPKKGPLVINVGWRLLSVR